MLYYLSRRRLPTSESDVDDLMKMAHAIQQLRMCDAFSAVGEEVCFVSPGRVRNDPSWDVISEYYGLSTRFDLKVARSLPRNYGFPNYPVPDTDTQAMTSWLLYTYLSGGFDSDDVIYSRNLDPTRYFLQFLEWFGSDVDVSIWFEQHQLDRGLGETAVGGQEVFYGRLDGLVCISEALKQRIVDQYPIDSDDVVVAHDGANLQAYEGLSREKAREQLGIDPEEPIVMYTGHLYPSKDVGTLVRAAADFDAECYVVGGYPEDVSRIKTAVDVPNNVTFTGFVPPNEIPRYQAAADVLVATVAENPDEDYFSPLKLFEYMAAGKPIVMTRKPEYQEVLTHGETALFVDPSSPFDLSRAIESLLSNPQLRVDLGVRARDEVGQYSWTSRARHILNGIDGRSPVRAGIRQQA